VRALERAWLGRVPYGEALDAQRTRREAVMAGRAPEVLWALEHDPVITTGRREPEGLPDAAWLAERGVALFRSERGGLLTWHGPGQLVVYAIVDAAGRGLGPRALVGALEQGVIDWLAARGQEATRRAGYPGVWLPSPDSPAGLDKIAAVGLHFRRGISMHGLALNLRAALDGFALIVPCGIHDARPLSLHERDPLAPSPADAAPAVLDAIAARILAAGLDASATSR